MIIFVDLDYFQNKYSLIHVFLWILRLVKGCKKHSILSIQSLLRSFNSLKNVIVFFIKKIVRKLICNNYFIPSYTFLETKGSLVQYLK